jgi:hypothetical protein
VATSVLAESKYLPAKQQINNEPLPSRIGLACIQSKHDGSYPSRIDFSIEISMETYP